jgi:hypothetical protein
MRTTSPETLQPLNVAEQLDAMLLGWLEHHASEHTPRLAGLEAAAVITVADETVGEVETFCAKWDLTVTQLPRGDGDWTVLNVRGPVLPVQGFTEITRMYRR